MFSEIIITVPDVDAAVAFYTDACRFKHARTLVHEGTKVVELDAGGQRVTVIAGDDVGVRLVIDSDNIRADHRRLTRHGVADNDPVEVVGGSFLPFSDPYGVAFAYWKPADDEDR